MNNLDSICARVESARRDRLRKVVLRRENIIKNSAPYSFIFYRRTFFSPTFSKVRYYMSLSKWLWKVITSFLKYTDLICMTTDNIKRIPLSFLYQKTRKNSFIDIKCKRYLVVYLLLTIISTHDLQTQYLSLIYYIFRLADVEKYGLKRLNGWMTVV